MKQLVSLVKKPQTENNKHCTLPQLSAKAMSRLISQMNYLENEFSKYRIDGNKTDSLATLYRINECSRDYETELQSLASKIPPMNEKCRLSVVLCCHREAENIEHTLKEWTLKQQGVDPQEYEIIVLVNRPNPTVAWDNTVEKVENFKKQNKSYNVHVVEKK